MKNLYVVLAIAYLVISCSAKDKTQKATKDKAQQAMVIKEKIDSIMIKNYPENQPGAAIIAYKNNSPFFKGSYGLSNIEDSTKITDHTIFRIGSMSKQFTSIAILMMVEKGELKLSDNLTKFYPEWYSNKSPISIQQLLSHTSGVTDLPKIKGIRELMFKESKPDSLIKLISKSSLEFEPGEKYSYSNSGYVILGGILEKTSGMNYGDFLEKYIFNPLNMHSTYYIKTPEQNTDIADGYFQRPDHYVKAPKVNTSLMYAAGGLSSTLDDMAKWNLALNSSELIKRDLLERAFKPNKLNNGILTDYGFGFRQCEVNGEPSIEHGGGVFGYKSYGVRVENKGVYVLILSNFERGNSYDTLAPFIAAEVMNKSYYHIKSKKEIENELKVQLLGDYLIEPGDTLNIVFDGSTMLMTRNQKTRKLKRTDDKTFYCLEYKLEFEPNNNENQMIVKHRRSMKEFATKL